MLQIRYVPVSQRRWWSVPHALVVAALVGSGLVTFGAVSAATTAPSFARSDHPFLGNNHVVGDFNGDASLDLAGSGAQSAVVQLNNGAGAFGARVEYPVATWTQDLAAGDFNGDSRLDLVVTINDPTTGLSLLTGRGDGTFNAPVNFPNTSGFDSPAVVAVDLNNDSKLDVVIAHQIACYTAPCRVTQLISIMIGNGDGTFQPASEMDVGRGMSKMAVGDFNRDGNKDLAIAGDNSRVYRVFGVGDGTFVLQPTITIIPEQNIGMDNTDIDVADFNGDNIEDLVVAVSLNGSRTAILIGNGDGTFRAPLLITEPNLNVPQYQAVADYNGDGFQDLAISLGNGTQGLMEILNGNGNGTFQPLRYYLVPPPKSSISGYAIVAANLDGDSKPDLTLGISGASPAFAVLLNTTGATPPPTPAAPSLLTPSQDATPAQPVAFDWSDVTGAVSYRIQIDDSSTISSPFIINQTVTASQFTAPTLPSRQYWWRVQAISSSGVAGPFSSVRRFTLQTPPSAPTLSAMTLSPTSVVGGNVSQGTATLTSAAPSGGLVVTLSSNAPSTATVPASITVAAGSSRATFAVSTTAVTASTSVTITGTGGGTTRAAALTVTPPSQGASLTVTATGRSGERITSNPTGINVTVGSTGSASFATGTAITLTVSNGRDAIWSGACSSGGNKTKTCTFTFNGNATLTANVQ
jgi:hypothetical protein